MLKNQRRIPRLLSALLLWGCLAAACLLATGCAPAEKTAGSGTEHVLTGGTPVEYISVNSADYNYISDAGISNYLGELRTEVRGEDFTFSGSYIELDGLTDAGIEREINEKIYERYQALCQKTELPAYGGIKRIQNTTQMCDVGVSATRTDCVGNLFSVIFQKCWAFQNEDSWYWVTDKDAMVFDLKTGRQLSLSDLFREDVDYREVIDGQVRAQLPDVAAEAVGNYRYNDMYVYDEGGIRQVAPFGGIREDQMFSVTGQGIYIYFDERDRAFDTNFGNSGEMLIYYSDIGDSADYPLRFAAEQELYEEPISFTLVQNYHTKLEEKIEEDGDISERFSISWPKSLPVDKRDAMIAKDRREMESQIRQWRSQAAQKREEDSYSYLSYNVDIAQYGTHYNVRHSLYGMWGDHTADRVVCRIFEGQDLREIKPEELFVREFDLRGYLNEVLEQSLEEYRQGDAKEITCSIQEISDRTMTGIYADGIEFIFPVDEQGDYISLYQSYGEVGYENLTLFQ